MNYGHKSRSPDIDKLSGIEKRFHMNSQDKKLILFNDRAVPSSLQNHENGQLYRVRFDGQVYFNINPRISASSSAPLTSRPTNWCCFLLPFIWLVCCFCPLPGPRSSASLLFNEVTQTGVNVCEQVEQFNVQCQSRVSNCCRNWSTTRMTSIAILNLLLWDGGWTSLSSCPNILPFISMPKNGIDFTNKEVVKESESSTDTSHYMENS